MAKGQKRSTREKKKPKANKKVVVPTSSGFSSSLGQHKPDQGLGEEVVPRGASSGKPRRRKGGVARLSDKMMRQKEWVMNAGAIQLNVPAVSLQGFALPDTDLSSQISRAINCIGSSMFWA
jgi:hypothetical protein